MPQLKCPCLVGNRNVCAPSKSFCGPVARFGGPRAGRHLVFDFAGTRRRREDTCRLLRTRSCLRRKRSGRLHAKDRDSGSSPIRYRSDQITGVNQPDRPGASAVTLRCLLEQRTVGDGRVTATGIAGTLQRDRLAANSGSVSRRGRTLGRIRSENAGCDIQFAPGLGCRRNIAKFVNARTFPICGREATLWNDADSLHGAMAIVGRRSFKSLASRSAIARSARG